MTHVFLIGSKGIPARYGGFETFVEHLTKGKQAADIQYHVSCMENQERHFEYNNADCFAVKLPVPGPVGRMLHVAKALGQVEVWRKGHMGEKAIVYILGCRVGPFLIPHAERLRKMQVEICSNPDGLEWKRGKWKAPEKAFLKYCEKCLVDNSDLLICDSQSIEKYIRQKYGAKAPRTTYIAYGAEVRNSACSEEKLLAWYDRFGLKQNGYYLIVGRFVPENNFETMISEFMASKTSRDLVLITNIEHNKFYDQLKRNTAFEKDPRIKFVGTVYDQELLKKIREGAYGYLHGHEVGGTNPSLLEALASTKINLLLDVGFNREVARSVALYWNKSPGSLADAICQAEGLSQEEIDQLGEQAVSRIRDNFNWPMICAAYEEVWRNEAMGQAVP